MLTAQRSEEALDLLQDILAIELLMAATVAVGVPTGRALPAPIAAAFDATRRVREPLGRPARAAAVHAAVSAALCGDILEAALAEVAPAP